MQLKNKLIKMRNLIFLRQNHPPQINYQHFQSIFSHVCSSSDVQFLNLLTYYKEDEVLNKEAIAKGWSNFQPKRKHLKPWKKKCWTTRQMIKRMGNKNSIYSSVVNFNWTNGMEEKLRNKSFGWNLISLITNAVG